MISSANAPALAETYEGSVDQYLRFYSRITCIVTMVLVMLGMGLDFLFYRERVLEFGLIRAAVATMVGVTLVSYATAFGSRHIRQFTYFWVMLPQVMVAWMIFQTDGDASPYFVGLTFAVAGVGIFLPLTTKEAVAFGAITLGLYWLACIFHPRGVESWSRLAGASLFIGFFVVIAVTTSVYGSRWRRQTFLLQREVRLQNEVLRRVNATLAEVKGQLLQQEKMAAIGTLSAGLLHELNNPVNYSLMALGMAMQHTANSDDGLLKECLADTNEGLQRVQAIVSDLKTFAYQKPGDDPQREFALALSVTSALRLAGHELKGIDVRVNLPVDSRVIGDEPAIIGVLINLLSNAANALGKVRRDLPVIDITGSIDGPAARMRVVVRDNGSGIAADVIDRVFEPFFTTRDVGAGLGLGLSVSYGIVQRHGGQMLVRSEFGQWTEFSFDLPRPVA